MANLNRTQRDILATIGSGHFKHEVTVPAGTLCQRLKGVSAEHDRWVVAELSWIPKSSPHYHDAKYRGIEISDADLQDSQSDQSRNQDAPR